MTVPNLAVHRIEVVHVNRLSEEHHVMDQTGSNLDSVHQINRRARKDGILNALNRIHYDVAAPMILPHNVMRANAVAIMWTAVISLQWPFGLRNT